VVLFLLWTRFYLKTQTRYRFKSSIFLEVRTYEKFVWFLMGMLRLTSFVWILNWYLSASVSNRKCGGMILRHCHCSEYVYSPNDSSEQVIRRDGQGRPNAWRSARKGRRGCTTHYAERFFFFFFERYAVTRPRWVWWEARLGDQPSYSLCYFDKGTKTAVCSWRHFGSNCVVAVAQVVKTTPLVVSISAFAAYDPRID